MCEIAWYKGYFGSNMQLVSYVSTTRLGCIWVNWQRLGGYFGGGNRTLGTEVMDWEDHVLLRTVWVCLEVVRIFLYGGKRPESQNAPESYCAKQPAKYVAFRVLTNALIFSFICGRRHYTHAHVFLWKM
jgi:hypothetical protein